MNTILDHLQTLVRPGEGRRYCQAALARIERGGTTNAWLFGAPDGPQPRLRCASISKAATAHATLSLVIDGQLALDGQITEILPLDPQIFGGITVDMLLNHTSALTDDAGYIFDPPTQIFETLNRTVSLNSHASPLGTYFCYANLNYLLIGHILETVTQKRFDRILAEHVLKPAGISGGFNWADVPPAYRAHRLALYQRQNGALSLQIDGPEDDWNADLIWRNGRGVALDDYIPGSATAIFSPQAGLRANVSELAQLARLIGGPSPTARLQRTPTWAYDPQRENGAHCDGLFPCFGRGVTIYRDHPHIPSHLVGHAGHAMGFTGGAWHNMETGTSWAYFLTGSEDRTEGLESEAFYGPDELLIMQSF